MKLLDYVYIGQKKDYYITFRYFISKYTFRKDCKSKVFKLNSSL